MAASISALLAVTPLTTRRSVPCPPPAGHWARTSLKRSGCSQAVECLQKVYAGYAHASYRRAGSRRQRQDPTQRRTMRSQGLEDNSNYFRAPKITLQNFARTPTHLCPIYSS